ncbi:hypothetical protein ICM_06284 [Bacillus cereus BAG1X2-3]|uniref:Uncharacterized protein n=1 Tax=Bacillus cereus TaxID=1396 RepID=A0A9X7HNX6_BACCE|nr:MULTISPECIES: hypothetical protein [Bacillus cereus group]EOO23061.1 hypothetical protein ICC_06431 [Bacillus cereus BAG1X1-1]EOO42841.1 hypothetical protein ICI_06348 [Bacillus cereus BAG1X2-1]EOO43951.1 hypothetical protein ICK_06644 [Bacillus cereus BAG1X2-2]EOO55983.1 hypothetical protein ICM_06284 [Bacillus cereus BAG1X2-3]EOO99923.1 hypothetical protein ICO_06695 [Bacillus cereus BAG2O-1]
MLLEKVSGLLVGTLGVEKSVALAIAGLIASGGVWYAAVAYPFLAPFVATIQGVMAVAGTGAVVGW